MYEPKDILQATADISADWSVQATEGRDKQSSKDVTDVTSAGTDEDPPQTAQEEPARVSAEIGIVETSGTWSEVGSHASSQRDRSKKLSRRSPPPTYYPPSSDNQYRRDFLSELMSSSDEEESVDTRKGRSRAWNNQHSKSIDLQPSDLISSSDGTSMASSAAKSSSKAKPPSSWTKSPPGQAKRSAKSPRAQPSHVTGINIKKVARGRDKPPEDDTPAERNTLKARSGSAPSQLGERFRSAPPEADAWKIEDRRPARSKDREQNSSIRLVEEALSAVRRLDRTPASKSSPPVQGEASPGEFSIDDEIRQILEIDADIDAMLSTGFSPVKARKSPPSGRPLRTQRKAFPAESVESPAQNDARPHPASARGTGVIATRQSNSPPRQRMEYANSIEDEYAADEPTEIRALMLQGTYPQYRPARNPSVGKGMPVYRVSGKYNVPTSLRPPVVPVASKERFDTYSAWWDAKVPARGGGSKGAAAAPRLWDEEPHLITNTLAASPAAKDFGATKFKRSKYRSRTTPDKNERFDEYSPYVEKSGLENLPLEYRKQVAKKQEQKSGLRKSYMDDLLKTGTAAGFKSKANTWSSVQDFFHGDHAQPAAACSQSAALDVHPYF